MKRILTAAFMFLALSCFSQVHVRSYTRKDGTFVQAHERTKPDGILENNYSYPGNYNPNISLSMPIRSSNYSNNNYSNSTWIYPSFTTYNIPTYNLPTTSVINNANYSLRTITNVLPSEPVKPYSSQNQDSKGQSFEVTSDRAYFYNTPSATSIRNAYLVKGEKIDVISYRSGFYYVIYTNPIGQTSRGWISENNIYENSYQPVTPSLEQTYYVVISNKAYFYADHSYAHRKKAYLVKGELLKCLIENNGFGYVAFTNSLGQKTLGWIPLSDLVSN